jgi:hypothetical protein
MLHRQLGCDRVDCVSAAISAPSYVVAAAGFSFRFDLRNRALEYQGASAIAATALEKQSFMVNLAA